MAITAVPLTAATQHGMTLDYKDGVVRRTAAKATAATTIYQHSLVNRTTSTGYCLPAADTASTVQFAGIAAVGVTASTDSTNPVFSLYQHGDFLMTLNASTATEASVGTEVEVADDNTVDVAGQTSNHVKVGKIVEYLSSTQVRVRIDGYCF